jgi:hypothetical protein
MTLEEANLTFPVLCFTTHLEVWGASDAETLTTWSKYALKPREAEFGMQLIDVNGRRFILRSIYVVPRKGPWIHRLAQALAGIPKMRQVEFDLDSAPAVSLDEVKARFVASITDKPRSEHSDYDDRPNSYRSPLVKRVLRWIESTKSIQELSNRQWVFSIAQYIGPTGWMVADLYGQPAPRGRIAIFGSGIQAPSGEV